MFKSKDDVVKPRTHQDVMHDLQTRLKSKMAYYVNSDNIDLAISLIKLAKTVDAAIHEFCTKGQSSERYAKLLESFKNNGFRLETSSVTSALLATCFNTEEELDKTIEHLFRVHILTNKSGGTETRKLVDEIKRRPYLITLRLLEIFDVKFVKPATNS